MDVNLDGLEDTLEYLNTAASGAEVQFVINRPIKIVNNRNKINISVGPQKEDSDVWDVVVSNEFITVESVAWVLETLHKIEEIEDNFSCVNGWDISPKTEKGVVYSWTSRDGNTVSVEDSGSGYYVTRNGNLLSSQKSPVPNAEYSVNVYSSFTHLQCALVRAIAVMENNCAKETDKRMRMKELAENQFTEIPGVGDKTADNLINTKNIYTLEEVVNILYKSNIQPQYYNKVREYVETQIEQGENISSNTYVKSVDELYS